MAHHHHHGTPFASAAGGSGGSGGVDFSMSQSLFDLVSNNSFASGSILIGIWGVVSASLLSLLWAGWRLLKTQVQQKLYVEVDVPSTSQAHGWVSLWLAENSQVQAATSRCKVVLESETGPHARRRRGGPGAKVAESRSKAPKVHFLPREDVYQRVAFQGHLMWIRFIKKQPPSATDIIYGGAAETEESVRIITTRKQAISDFIEACHEAYVGKLKTHTVIWTIHRGGNSWRVLDSRPSRPLDTVILEGGVADDIRKDVQEFIDSESWYYARGIPYRRGYLLYGPPGCGKTSFITALAGELHLVICIINITSECLDDDKLLSLLSDAPKHSIILLEDIDAAFKPKDDAAEGQTADSGSPKPGRFDGKGIDARRGNQSRGITFSGLLNAIDGVAAQEGKLLFLTTNHIEKLDEALIRPGRVDLRAYFGRASKDRAARLYQRFFRGHPTMDDRQIEKLGHAFAATIPEDRMSMAQIQGHLMDYRQDPRGACENIASYVSLSRQATASEEDAEPPGLVRSLSRPDDESDEW